MRALAFAVTCLLATSSVVACNKEEPKKVQDEPKKATPVPSDMVLNDFLPAQGGAQGLAVRGADGGLLEAGLGEMAAAGDAAAAPAADTATKLKVLDPGAEPRAARKYAFTPNKTERRVIVLKQTISQGPQKQEQPPLQMTLDLTPKAVKPDGGTPFEMKIVSVDIADKDKIDPRLQAQLAQVTQQLKAFAGMSATFDVDPHGGVGEVQLKGNSAKAEGAEEILGAFQQAVELMLAPLPDAPIGVGAKWERALEEQQMGITIKSRHTFEAKELDKDGATIVATVEQKVPKRTIPDPRARGASVQIDGNGTYTYTVRFDRIATKVQGELVRKETIEAPGESGKKETVTRETKIAHTMSAPPGK